MLEIWWYWLFSFIEANNIFLLKSFYQTNVNLFFAYPASNQTELKWVKYCQWLLWSYYDNQISDH